MSWGLNSKVSVLVETGLCRSGCTEAFKQGEDLKPLVSSGERCRGISEREVSHVFRTAELGEARQETVLTSQAGRGRDVRPEEQEEHSLAAGLPSAGVS